MTIITHIKHNQYPLVRSTEEQITGSELCIMFAKRLDYIEFLVKECWGKHYYF